LVLLVAVVGLVAPATPAAADTYSDEAWFVAQINQLRQSRGLNALSVDSELTGQARHWAQVMANDNQLKHTSDMSVGISAPWDVLGENVGVHELARVDNLQELFQAFVSSPSHLDNLLDPRFEHVGVGVVYDGNGKIWTAHRFMSVTGESPATTASPATSPPPPPTAAPATSPPTTSPAAPPPPTAAARPTTTPSSATASTVAADPGTSAPQPAEWPDHRIDPELIAQFLAELAAAGI
jgi:hypothetical protein